MPERRAEMRLEVNGHSDARLTARALEGLTHGIHRLPYAMRVAIVDPAIIQAGSIIVRRARTPNLRFRDHTGRLRRSIRVRVLKSGIRRFTNIVAGGRQGSHHAFIIEEGTEGRFGGAGRRTRARSNRRTSVIRRQIDAERVAAARASGRLKFRGKVEARRFLAGAVDDSEAEVLQSVIQYGRAQLDEMTEVAREGTGLRK